MRVTHPGPIVSYEDDELILVDDQDRVIGYRSKKACHQGDGVLHRAFSVFLFDDRQQLLLQQRSATKPLWPLTWSNSCCSHPRRNEGTEYAAARRLREELAVSSDLHFLFKFLYRASNGNAGTEHEMCSVFVGRVEAQNVKPNEHEVNDWRFTAPNELEHEIQRDPFRFTPWMKTAWARIRQNHWTDIQRL